MRPLHRDGNGDGGGGSVHTSPGGSHGERGVSATLSYVLILTIVTMLISGLFMAGSGFVESQQDRAIRSEFDVLGNRLASDIAAADRMVRTGAETVKIEEDLPQSVANTPYRITVEDDGAIGGQHDVTLTYTTSSPSINVSVTLRTGTPVAETTAPGGDVVIEYDEAANEVVVSHG